MVRQTMFERWQGKRPPMAAGCTPRWTATRNGHSRPLRAGLTECDVRHGYRGPESFIDLKTLPAGGRDESLDESLAAIRDSGKLQPGVVLEANANKVVVYMRGGRR